MATPSSTATSSSFSPASPSSASSDTYTPTEWTQQSMLGDLMQQKGLLIGAGTVLVGLLFFFRSRSRPEEKAARRLVRDFRHVDDPDDVRGVLGENLPTIVRPALLIALEEIERQVSHIFDRLEREISHL
jgi:hypothetical protein